MAKNPNLKAKEAHTDLMHQKDRLENRVKRLNHKIDHIKEEIEKLKDWVRLGAKALQCSNEWGSFL